MIIRALPLLLAFAAALFLPLSAQAKVALARIFSDGLIVQKDKPLTIFGTALQGEIVSVQVGQTMGQQIVGRNGRFVITLPATVLSETGPFDIKITGQNTITIKNVRAGQVWLVAGESLVEGSLEGEGDIDAQMPDNLYIYKPAVQIKRNPDFVGAPSSGWLRAESREAKKLGALAQLFGRDLANSLKEPVGIIQVSANSTPLRAWMSEGGFATKQDSRSVQQKYQLDEDTYNRLCRDWAADPAEIPAELAGMSSGIYNGMVAQLIPFALKGVVFCQGESDVKTPLVYKSLFPLFINDLRTAFNQQQLPLIYLQLGAQPSQSVDKDNNSEAASIRLTQLKARVAPRSYLVVSSDLCREDVKAGTISVSAADLARRLANVAMGAVYKDSRPYLTPLVEYTEVEGETMKVVFKNAPSGLVCRDKKLKSFALAGHDHKFFDATASLDGLTVYLQSQFVKSPRFVRYGWGNNPRLPLYSRDGMPASPYADDR